MRRFLFAALVVILGAAGSGSILAAYSYFPQTWAGDFEEGGGALIAEARSRRHFFSPREVLERRVLARSGEQVRNYAQYLYFQPHLLRAGSRLRRIDARLQIHLPRDPAVAAIRERLSLGVLNLQETAVHLARESLAPLEEDGEGDVAAAVRARLLGIEPILAAAGEETEPGARHALLARSGRRLRLLWDVDLGDTAGVESRVLATLRAIRAAQESFRSAAHVDADGDGAGEFGTLSELAGATGVRAGVVPGPSPGSDFSVRGGLVEPPLLPSSFGDIDALGNAVRHGYVFLLYLPADYGGSVGFVHEAGPRSRPSLPVPVDVDSSESLWCAYAVPVVRGIGGTRAYFIHADGTVLYSNNDRYPHQGTFNVAQGASAFLGYGMDEPLAVGTTGLDFNVWRPVDE